MPEEESEGRVFFYSPGLTVFPEACLTPPPPPEVEKARESARQVAAMMMYVSQKWNLQKVFAQVLS